MHRKNFVCFMLPFCLLMASCASENEYPDVSETASAEIRTYAEASENLTDITEIPSETTEISSVSETEEASETSDTETETVPETESETEASSETEPVTAETVTSLLGSVTEASVYSAASSYSETVAESPKAPVVIPQITLPSAPGTKCEISDTAEIDYSNAACGYIYAGYSGSGGAAKLRVKCGDVQYDHDITVGEKGEFFPLMQSGSYSVKIYEKVAGKSYAEVVSADFDVSIADDKAMYLYPNKYSDFDSSSQCVKKAAELCAGKTDDIEKVSAIFEYTAGNIVYDRQLAATVKSGYIPDPDRTLSSGKGICFDYASLMTAMCRSQGIPARLVIGYASPDIYHAWNEIYTEETGWITPELFFSHNGYNLADATFYAGNPDKEKISAYISDSSNYSAVYRY